MRRKNAEGGTRTPTRLPSPAPEAGASAIPPLRRGESILPPPGGMANNKWRGSPEPLAGIEITRAMKGGLHAAFGRGTIGAIVRAKEARRPAGNKLPCACSTDVRGVALNMSPQEITKTFTAMLAPDNQRVASYLWLTHRLWNHQLEFVVSEYLHLRSRKENKYAAAI